MNHHHLFVLQLLLVISASGPSCAQSRSRKYLLNKPQCNDESLRNIELSIARMNPMGKQRAFPENMEQMKQFCKEARQTMRTVESFFNECFKKSVRDYASILLYTIKKNLRKFCGSAGRKTVNRYLRLGPCANQHIKPRNAPCAASFMAKIAALIGLAEDKHKIAHACCHYLDYLRCAERFLDTVPCIADQKAALMELFRSSTSSVTEIMCGRYNAESDACEALGPPPPPTRNITKQYTSPVFLSIDLLESFKSFDAPKDLDSF